MLQQKLGISQQSWTSELFIELFVRKLRNTLDDHDDDDDDDDDDDGGGGGRMVNG